MKQSISHLLAALVLLLWTTSAGAESYTGTLERHGAKIEYSFSGECKVTDKTKAEYGGLYPTTVGTSIDGEVKVGSTLNLSCKKLKGSEKWKTVTLSIVVGTDNGNFINYDNIKSDNVVSKSITVPEEVVTNDGNKEKVKSIHISYYYRTLVSGTSCNVDLKAVRDVGSTETYRGKSEVVIAFEEPEGYCNYTITGRNVRRTSDNSTELEADYYVGETVTVTCDGDADGAPYESYISYGTDEVKKLNGGVEKTFTIRKPNEDQADYISIGCCMAGLSNMDGTMSFQVCGGAQVRINIIDPNTEQPVATGNWEWNEVSPDERCSGCHGQWANYYIHTETAFDSNNEPYYGDPAMVCMSRTRQNVPDQNIFEYYLRYFSEDFGSHPGSSWEKLEFYYHYDLFYNNVISTRNGGRVVLDDGDEEGSIIIEPQSAAHLVKRNADGSDRWNVYMGRIIGKHLKHVDKEPVFETANIQARPTGTVFVLEADAKMSRVYLLSGSMDVASKKTKKKVTLKPGQASTTDANGQMKVQKFDIKKAARKFGITDDELQGTASTSTKRYEVERGLVKYKLTKGSEEGVMAKLFDSYGRMERRELKMPSQQTVQITHGNTSYRLNTQQKTAQGVKDAELNFLDFSIPIMKKLNLKKTGTGKVLDRQCDIYTNATMEYYVWKGIVLKKVEHTGNTATVTEATSLEQPATVDGSLFKIPNGYTLKK